MSSISGKKGREEAYGGFYDSRGKKKKIDVVLGRRREGRGARRPRFPFP